MQGLDLNQRPSGYEPAIIDAVQQWFTPFQTPDFVQNHVVCGKAVSPSLATPLEIALRLAVLLVLGGVVVGPPIHTTSEPMAEWLSSKMVFTSSPSPQTMIRANRLNQRPDGTVGSVESVWANNALLGSDQAAPVKSQSRCFGLRERRSAPRESARWALFVVPRIG